MTRFITFEGIEGTGKSTIIKLLAEKLIQKQYPITLTREPGGSVTAEAIRRLVLESATNPIDPLTELLLMYAARKQHLEEIVKPALSEGRVVLCDRFYDASHAYQGAGRNLGQGQIDALDTWIVASTVPDLTLLFDAPIDICLQRIKKRQKKDRFDQESIAFYQRVQEAYRERARLFPERIQVIDASQPIHEVLSRVAKVVIALLEH